MHTNKIPLYEKIYHDLREKIQTNYYKAGEIIPTEPRTHEPLSCIKSHGQKSNRSACRGGSAD